MNIFELFPFLRSNLFIKIPFLVVIGIYAMFAFILFNKTKSLEKIIFIEASGITHLLSLFSLIHFLITVLLFVAAIVIL